MKALSRTKNACGWATRREFFEKPSNTRIFWRDGMGVKFRIPQLSVADRTLFVFEIQTDRILSTTDRIQVLKSFTCEILNIRCG